MEEDEIGMRKVLDHTHANATYVQCARCGKTILESEAVAAPADAFDEAADFSLICRSCRDELENGEQDLPLASE